MFVFVLEREFHKCFYLLNTFFFLCSVPPGPESRGCGRHLAPPEAAAPPTSDVTTRTAAAPSHRLTTWAHITLHLQMMSFLRHNADPPTPTPQIDDITALCGDISWAERNHGQNYSKFAGYLKEQSVCMKRELILGNIWGCNDVWWSCPRHRAPPPSACLISEITAAKFSPDRIFVHRVLQMCIHVWFHVDPLGLDQCDEHFFSILYL